MIINETCHVTQKPILTLSCFSCPVLRLSVVNKDLNLLESIDDHLFMNVIS